MIIVANLRLSGFFAVITNWVSTRPELHAEKDHPRPQILIDRAPAIDMLSASRRPEQVPRDFAFQGDDMTKFRKGLTCRSMNC